MKISDQQKMVLWQGVKAFRKYKLRPYNEVEKKRDLRNLHLHEKEIKDGHFHMYNVCSIIMIKQRLENYED